MPDFLAGQTLTALHFTVTVEDSVTEQFTTTSTTFTVGAETPCGVAFVAPTSGRVKLDYAAQMKNSSSTIGTIIAPVVRTGSTVGSGTVVLAASLDNMVQVTGDIGTGGGNRQGAATLVSGLTPGSSYNVRLEHRVGGASTGTIERRTVIVTPAT